MEPPAGALFVSPHLDDAVLGCGELIGSAERATVLTLFAGRPPATPALTEWDRAAGFAEGEDVIGARREEDREALAALGGAALWLDFLDDQYGGREPPSVLAAALAAFIAGRPCTSLFLPAGLFHRDHARASDAALALLRTQPRIAGYLYEEPMYRRIDAARDARLQALHAGGLLLEPVQFRRADGADARKRDAVACYRSQLRALGTRGGHDDAFADERYWRVGWAA